MRNRPHQRIPCSLGYKKAARPPTPKSEQSSTRNSTGDATDKLVEHFKAQLGICSPDLPPNGALETPDVSPQRVRADFPDAMQGQPTTFEPHASDYNSAARRNNRRVVVNDGIIGPMLYAVPPASPREVFSDYQESCEINPSIANRGQKKVYNDAISRDVEEVTHFRDVDTSLTTPPTFAIDTSTDPTAGYTPTSPTPGPSSVPNGDRAGSRSASGGSDATVVPQRSEAQERKLGLIKEIQTMKGSGRVKPEHINRFAAMANMVLRIEKILFLRRGAASQPGNFISAEVTWNVRNMVLEMTKDLTRRNDYIDSRVCQMRRVTLVVSGIASANIPTFTRYQQSARLVGTYLKRPNLSEFRLLQVFLELYDVAVYTPFFTSGNTHCVIEENLNIERSELSDLLISLRDALNKVIENYQMYCNGIAFLKEQYIAPLYNELLAAPELWTERWHGRYRRMMRLSESP